jgi:hypothetical protein
MRSQTSATSRSPCPPTPPPAPSHSPSPLSEASALSPKKACVPSECSESAASVTADRAGLHICRKKSAPSAIGETIDTEPMYTLETHPFYAAAVGGEPSAQYNLAVALFNGDAIDKNVKESMQWLFSAAKLGHFMALHSVGLLYLNSGAFENALFCMNASASKGYAPSMFQLGMMYLQGKGVEKNQERALLLFKMAVKHGDAAAMGQLADLMPDAPLAHRLALLRSATRA